MSHARNRDEEGPRIRKALTTPRGAVEAGTPLCEPVAPTKLYRRESATQAGASNAEPPEAGETDAETIMIPCVEGQVGWGGSASRVDRVVS